MDDSQKLDLVHMVRPADSSPAEGGSPGLLLLHGRGADEADLMGLEAALDPRLVIVSARAPFRLGPGFAWYGMAQVGHPEEETMQTSIEELRRFIEGMVPAYGINPDQLYLMGFSQGAVMCAAVSLTLPVGVRGVVMHSGYVPVEAGIELKPEQVRDKPFFVAHGKYDDVIPVTFGRDADEYLIEAGAGVTYREYPIGHSISEESLYDLAEWLTAELDS